MPSYGRAFWTGIGVFIAGLPQLVPLPEPWSKICVVAGAVIVFTAQQLFQAGLIPEAKRRR